MSHRRSALLLAILDGWGHSDRREGNAVAACPSDHMRRLADCYPSTLLSASGEAVGLPGGVMGNSEVGHLTIGAGRVIQQDLTRINRTVRDGSLARCAALREAFDLTARAGTTVHFLGLCSDAGVHSHLDHLHALLEMAAACGARFLRVHAFTDGRDTPPTSGLGYVTDLTAFLGRLDTDAAIATVCGRYYAMDRDRRWDRLEKAWCALVLGEGLRAPSPAAAVQASYDRDETDEFLLPTVIDGVSRGQIADGDVVVFFNLRADRAREMTRALTAESFEPFARPRVPRPGRFVCLTRYDEESRLPVVLPPEHPEWPMGRLFADRGARQLRIAETEKYAHVTYFLNGGVERVYAGEERILVPSSKVATYDLEPEMQAAELTGRVVEALRAAETDVIVLNFANADMVGHTGNYAATLRACEVVDRSIGTLAEAARSSGALMAVTADHGNAEQMLHPVSGGIHTAHTTNPVPLILVSEELKGARLADDGGLSSVLPTALTALGIEPPAAMEGRSLL